MKELTIEEKAKRYDEALERAKKLYNDGNSPVATTVEEIFPELKESEDERIRKELIAHFKTNSVSESWSGLNVKKVIAWLEKQGEQKPDDNRLIPQKGEYYVCIKDYYSADGKTTNTKGKIYKSPCDGYINDDKGFGLSWINSCTENHFRPIKEEDWIICEQNNVIGKPLKYKEFMNNKLIQKNIKSLEDNGIVPNFRLWDISDAKDGDVLSDGTTIFIFKNLLSDGSVMSYCDYDTDSGESDAFCPLSVNLMCSKITPSTKEQRDILFQKMKEAGLEWDSEKKKLSKVEDKEYNGEDYGIDGLWHAINILEKTLGKADGYQTDDGFLSHQCAITAVKKLYKQKPAWSEEDEVYLNTTIAYLKDAQEFKKTAENCINWLKSLKERATWKPSDEQMVVLELASKYERVFTPKQISVLIDLKEQLKKLKGE